MKKSAGFTLIELLIVVAIIGILAAIAVPNFMNAQIRAKVARTKGDLKAVATALETYRVDKNAYLLIPDPTCPFEHRSDHAGQLYLICSDGGSLWWSRQI